MARNICLIIYLFSCLASKSGQINVKKTWKKETLKTITKNNSVSFLPKGHRMWRFSGVCTPLNEMLYYLLAFLPHANNRCNTTLIVSPLGVRWEDIQYWRSVKRQLLHCHGTWWHGTYSWSKCLVNKKVKEAISGGIQFYCVPRTIWLKYKLTAGQFLLLESQRWPRALYQA